jgi:hypothetical protein
MQMLTASKKNSYSNGINYDLVEIEGSNCARVKVYIHHYLFSFPSLNFREVQNNNSIQIFNLTLFII